MWRDVDPVADTMIEARIVHQKCTLARAFTSPEGTTSRVHADRGAEIYQEASYNPAW
jgi:hypothetical protein